jgi:hypothetical protein
MGPLHVSCPQAGLSVAGYILRRRVGFRHAETASAGPSSELSAQATSVAQDAEKQNTW